LRETRIERGFTIDVSKWLILFFMMTDQADLLDDEEDLDLMYLTRLRNAELSKSGPFRGGYGSAGSNASEAGWHAREEIEELIEGYVQVRGRWQ